MSVPNILHHDVPVGEDESGNTQHSLHGEKPAFEFQPRTHNELIEMNKWVDLPRAAKIAGSRFFFLKGDLAHLELALQQYAVDFVAERGFTFVQPPVMMNREAYEGVTDLGDFESVMYNVALKDSTRLRPANTLTAMFMDEVIEPSLLPIKMVGVSPCFRRESVPTVKATRAFGVFINSQRSNKSLFVILISHGKRMKSCWTTVLTYGTVLGFTMRW